jgi:acetyl esterase/lipase
MPLDRHVKRFLDKLAATSPVEAADQTVEERRRSVQQLLGLSGTKAEVALVEDRVATGAEGPLRLRLYSPAGAAPGLLPGILYFHGGGLVAGSLDTHDPICRAIARASGYRLVSVDYRLAPEHRFPAAIADGLAAARWVAKHAEDLQIDSRRLVIGGDSAGATLAAVVCHACRDAELRFALQFLLCPITDFLAQTPSRCDLAQGYLLDEGTLRHDLRHYLAEGADPADPRVSPLRAGDLAGLPPACIHTAEYDPLRDEGAAYAQRLREAGVPTVYRCHPGMIHLFYGMGAVIPYAATAYALMASDIRALLEPQHGVNAGVGL